MRTEYIDLKDKGMICIKTGATDFLQKGEDGKTHLAIRSSNEVLDSDGDIVHQRKSKNGTGWDLLQFNKAPVGTWSHDMYRPNLFSPLTKAKVKRHESKGWGLNIEPLVFDPGDDYAMALDGKMRRGTLTESSVGFKALDAIPRKNEEGMRTGLDIYSPELIEVAIVNRGANPDTEVLAKRMLGRPDFIKQVEDGGSAEIEELKAEVEHLADVIKMLQNTMSAFGDQQEKEAHEFLMAKEKKDAKDAEMVVTLDSVLKALKGEGIKR